ncbi:MAG: hypothetical protein ALECFALPRED_001821 [Alectoria fallacina]|uniref:Uncharacterized protein n=1 Tax=Alectoria fallacina TaxID=1903189 RepID=A0A8H3FA52_9LECA|nr:MAG: hypothetical protein ALECFALPRED_001821 [Alectoria fallacina]
MRQIRSGRAVSDPVRRHAGTHRSRMPSCAHRIHGPGAQAPAQARHRPPAPEPVRTSAQMGPVVAARSIVEQDWGPWGLSATAQITRLILATPAAYQLAERDPPTGNSIGSRRWRERTGMRKKRQPGDDAVEDGEDGSGREGRGTARDDDDDSGS